MMTPTHYRTIDIALFVIANLVNLLMIGIFLSRPARLESVELVLGILFIMMALPVGAAVILNALGGREWWTWILPIPLILFCVVELVLDYILKLDFRNTALLWPYLISYYLAVIAMMGYAFGVGKSYGLITLGTYVINLLATWYSYSRVGHG
jgi:hypothetical protein